MNLDQIWSVVTEKSPNIPAQEGFGNVAVMAFHEEYTDRIRTYGSIDEIENDFPDVAVTREIRRLAEIVLGQKPRRPTTLRIIRATQPTEKTFRLTPITTEPGYVYEFDIVDVNGDIHPIEYEVQPADTVALICDGLFAQINPLTEQVAVDGTTHLDVSAAVAGDFFRFERLPSSLELEVEDRSAAPSNIAADLSAARTQDQDWFFLYGLSNAKTEIAARATWAETRRVMHFSQTTDSENQKVGVTSGILNTLAGLGRRNSATGYYSKGTDSAMALALLGQKAPINLDQRTSTFEDTILGGVLPDKLTDGQIAQIELDVRNGFHFTRTAGYNVVRNSRVANGQWMDEVRGIYWITVRIQNAVYNLQVAASNNGSRIPLTDTGLAAIKGVILSTINQGIPTGFFATDPAPVVFMPKAADISQADRDARRVSGITWTARLAGAVHKGDIVGTVT